MQGRLYLDLHLRPLGHLFGREVVPELAEPRVQVGKAVLVRDVEELGEEGRPELGVPPPPHGAAGEGLALLVLDELHVGSRQQDVRGARDPEVVDLVGPRLALFHFRAAEFLL